MLARCVCPKHGKLSMDDIVIKNNMPVCRKCSSPLEFCNIKPRKVKK